MQMLNMSWPWALLGSRFWINVAISSLVKVTVEIDLSVFSQILEGSSLELFIVEHCLAKKAVKRFCLVFKISYVLFWWRRGGMQWFFLLFNNDFNIDQYAFALVIGSMSFLEIPKDYLSLLLSVKKFKLVLKILHFLIYLGIFVT